MAGICSKALIVVVAALALVAGASAASPDVSAMNLRAADVPGAKIVAQGAFKEKGYIAAYSRSFHFSAPRGSSRLVGLEAETSLAATPSLAAADVAFTERQLRSSAGRKHFIATVAKGAKAKPQAVIVGALRDIAGYDQGFEVLFSFPVKGGRRYESFVFLRLDRVFVNMFEQGLRSIKAADTAKYATAIAGHIGTELSPIVVLLPTVTGTARGGQTLTAKPGAWTAADATFSYQWQRCNAARSNCADVSGATRKTYAVTPADAGSTLLVVVKATTRFGSSTAPSKPTPIVS